MKTRNVKCTFCKKPEKYPQTDMVVENLNVEGKKNFYYHYDCYDKHLVAIEKKKIELEQWDSLFRAVQKIHNVELIPRGIIVLLQDLRNGTIKYNGMKKKKFKDGVEYPVIEKAYQLASKKISWAKRNKKFKNTNAEMFYCLMIVYDTINEAKKEIKRLEAVNEMYVNPNHSYSEFNVEPITKEFPNS